MITKKSGNYKLLSILFLSAVVILFIVLKWKNIFNITGRMKANFSAEKRLEIQRKLASIFYFNLLGKKINSISKRFIIKYRPGGIIFLGNNVKNPKQLKKFINQINTLYNEISNKKFVNHPLMAIDQEGGRVRRLKKGFPKFPSAMETASRGPDYVKEVAALTSKALKNIGINVNFAPVADVSVNPLNKVIGNRAFSRDQNIAAKMVEIYIKEALKNGIIPCAKHFPGHGNVSQDSHSVLPVDNSNINELLLKPFEQAIKARVPMIMTAHILFPKIDNMPATMSNTLISILRKKLKFNGIIVSDDLSMGALKKNFDSAKVVINSLKAGINMFIHTAIRYGDHIKLLQKVTKLLEKDVTALIALDKAYLKVKNLRNQFN